MISHHVIPGDTDHRDVRVRRFEKIEIIEEDVAESNAEFGIGADEFSNDVMRHVVDLLNASWLRITEKNRLKRVWLLCGSEREIDRLG